MAEVAEPVWQENYVDLGDDGSIRFGGECLICQARYATNAEAVGSAAPGAPEGVSAQAFEEQKFTAFSDFDAAFRSLLIPCFRCGKLACPECWDVDKQMCGACVAERGLIRSPHHGLPVDGPLADGFLRRIQPGRYSEAGRPAWLKELLRAQADPPSARSLSSPALSMASLASQAADPAQSETAADAGDSMYLRAPALPFNPQQFEVPTFKLPVSAAPVLPQPTYHDALGGNEGEATASLIPCPQCGARNYDFVTQCAQCGRQLIQICQRCEHLNPGHAQQCQACGAPLERPSGWTSVRSPVLQLQRGERPRQPTQPADRAPSPRAQRNKRPIKNSGAVALQPAGQRVAAPVLAAQPALAFGAADAMALSGGGAHPYEVAGSGLRPVIAPRGGARANTYRPSLLSGVGLAIERLLTAVLVLAVIAVIALAVAAEQSPAANHWLTLTLHLDIKAHLDRMLYWLRVQLHLSPQS
ncbi:MAG TPA: hypothetical protein VGN32_16475 [Ktedonobacterales bacterium]|jgi:ribosomal protein L40E|nr:hypothetical protein [Ktedonobacterales bacterium]